MYQYELYIYNSDLQKLLWTIHQCADHHLKINTVQILKRYPKQTKILNLINFHINLKIDQLCTNFNLNLNQFNYIPSYTKGNDTNNADNYNLMKKQINTKKWLFHRKLKKKQKQFILNLINIKSIFKYINLINLINFDKAFNDSDISKLLDTSYYRNVKLSIDSSCMDLLYLVDFVLDANTIGVDDLEEILLRFGHRIETFVGNIELISFQNYDVDEKIKFVMYMIGKHCSNIKRIVLNGTCLSPMLLKIPDNSPIIPTSGGESYSAYFTKNELDKFIKELHLQNMIYSLKKISNIKLNYDKNVNKILRLQIYSSTIIFIQKVKSLTESKLKFQSAFRWHNEHYFKWKKLFISDKLKTELSYFVMQTNLVKYLNFNDLMSTNEAFYDISNFEFFISNYQIYYIRKLILKNNNEFKLYEYLSTLNRDYITIYQFINLLKIFGNFIEIFNGSEYLITVPRYTQFKLEKIYFFIRKYCKNLKTIIMDGHVINKIKNLNNNNKLIINDSNHQDLMPLAADNSTIEEINIKDNRNITKDAFLKIIKMPHLKEIFINSLYDLLPNWSFLLSKSYDLQNLSLQAIFEIYLYNDSIDNKPVEDNYTSEMFIKNFLKFLDHYNRNRHVKLGFYLYDCFVEDFECFRDTKINWVGFSNMSLSHKDFIVLGKCRNLFRIEFLNCDKLTDEYLFVLCQTINETNRFNEKVDVIIRNSFITNEFIYSYAAYHLQRSTKRKIFSYWQHQNIKFKFLYCSITVDWENADFKLSDAGDYVDIIDKTTKGKANVESNVKSESDYNLYIS